MISIQYQFTKISSQLNIEKIQNILILMIIFLIIFVAALALNRPVNKVHYQQVVELSHQNRFEASQSMATSMLAQEHIKNIDFYRLLNAYRIERNKVNIIPAVDQSES